MALKKLSLSVALAATALTLAPAAVAHADDTPVNPLGSYCYEQNGQRLFSTQNWDNYTSDLVSYKFQLTDGSTTPATPYKGNGPSYSSLDLPVGATYKTLILTYQDGSTKSFDVTDPKDRNGCRATTPAPKVAQKAVCGENNDDFPLDPSLSVIDDSGWQDGKRTITVGNSRANPATRPGIPIYSVTDPHQEGAMLTYNLTDDGACDKTVTTQVPVTTTTRQAYTAYRDVPVYKTVVNNPTVTVQVDQYLPLHRKGYWLNGHKLKANQALTPWERTVLARLDDDNLLGYDEDHFMWGGASNTKFVTLSALDIQKAGGFAKAIQQRTGWLPTANYGAAQVPVGATVVKAWVLGPGATVKAPWGGNHKVAQRDFDIATPQVTTTQVQVGTTKQAYTAYRDVTTTTTVTKTTTIPATPPAYTLSARSNAAF